MEENHHRKKGVVKSKSICFVPANHSAIDEPTDESSLRNNLTLKNEIYSYLPSQTLYRRKHPKVTAQVNKGLTLPRASTSSETSLDTFRRKLSSIQRKTSSLDGHQRAPQENADGIEMFGDQELCLTLEEKNEELKNLRNLPITMKEKRKYRKALFETFPTGAESPASLRTRVSNAFSHQKKYLSDLDLWNESLKQIEGHFGTSVVSYFVFLRWLIFLNLLTLLIFLLIVVIPRVVFTTLPHLDLHVVPKESRINDKFLSQFPQHDSGKHIPKDIQLKNWSSSFMKNDDLLSSVGQLFDQYLPDDILDLTVNYGRKNFTFEERSNLSAYCNAKYVKEAQNVTSGLLSFAQDLLQGTGWLESTILFLGYYPPEEIKLPFIGLKFDLPAALLFAIIISFFLCLWMMIRYSSQGIQEHLLSRKNNYLVYSNILFCSWDYCIRDEKTAKVTHKSILREIKSSLAEEQRKEEVAGWSAAEKLKLYFIRVSVHVFTFLSLFGCYYLIYTVVSIQLEELRLHRLHDPGISTLFVQFLSPITITGLNIFMPIIFYNVVRFERYNPRTEINMALVRIVFLRLSSLFVLVGLLHKEITCEPKDMCKAGMNNDCRSPLCWETYVGQQMYKLVITDLFVYICIYFAVDLFRDCIVQKFRNKVTELVGRQVFDIPSQVLSLVYSQTLCWLGIIYSPLIVVFTIIKFIIIFYLKRNAVLNHTVPAPTAYKAARINAIFMIILKLSFFVVTVVHGYALTSIETSPGCSPFRYYNVMMDAITNLLHQWSPSFADFTCFLFSAFFFIPAFILLSLSIYYYWTVAVTHRKMTKIIRAQIALEARDKDFLLNKLVESAQKNID
ncbi:transmembrane channel-like protein 7 [Uloborus diversus]|uniref:transmembrane channel-like protein 7 n=1 Tax=Uloborus diversus TaxID=327109 RepID=UPI00240A3C1B|nr:transmembrane channel-like protein 7 [Uloborus diversus]